MIRRWLLRTSSFWLTTYALVAAFGVYFCMYAFRKPFTVATFENLSFFGMDYKIILIIAQVVGYMLSKFIGIKVISEMLHRWRAAMILAFIGFAELSLLFFAIVPTPYNIIFLFLNGLPLGMIWGLVFSFLEGRKTTEILGAGLSASFIVSSGAVKSVGKVVLDSWNFSPFWMPVVTGGIFILPLLLFTWMLSLLPEPSEEDIALRTRRKPMNRRERRSFFVSFATGLILIVLFYMMLTAYRDFRDNFAAEIWIALGYGNAPEIFTLAEIPIAVFVLIMLGLTMYIRNNGKAFLTYHVLIIAGVILIGGSTWMFQQNQLDGAYWMVLVGLGLYMGYVPINSIFFDRMIAAFHYQSNAGFMIYVADAFGYLGSVGILIYKNFGQPDLSWIDFFIGASYALAIFGTILVGIATIYFRRQLFSRTFLVKPVNT